MGKKVNLKLANLFLDLQNPRFEEQHSQSEALNTMASDQGDRLLRLLVDIIEHGLNPSDLPIVMPADDEGHIVLEGNRRIAALKLLRRPAILSDIRLQKKSKKLHDLYKDKAPKTIECLEVSSREEADIWIERKHEGTLNGVGTIPWDNVQKARYMANKTGKDSKAVQVIDFMRKATEGDDTFAELIQSIKATNLERLISSPEVRFVLGLDLSQGEMSGLYPAEEVMKGLRYIVERMADKDFNVRIIYRKEDRLKFIKEIPAECKPDKSKESDTPWKLKDYNRELEERKKYNSNGVTGRLSEDESDNQKDHSEETNNPKQRPTTRKTFIREDLELFIPNERINRLFCELKEISHLQFPNVCAILFRVVLELSIDFYLDEFKLVQKGANCAARDKRSLDEKFNVVADKLTEQKYLNSNTAKGMKTSFSKTDSIFSAHTLNAYVHNSSFNPIPGDLMLSWDNAEPFVIALWKAVSEQYKKNQEKQK